MVTRCIGTRQTKAVARIMPISDIMAIRGAVLDNNVALRASATTSARVLGSEAVGRSTFEAAMNSALQKAESASSIGGPNGPPQVASLESAPDSGFVSTFKAQLETVNGLNARAGALTVAYERGEETDIVKVMLARQASAIGFEATLQVRNKLLSAYKDIMNMAL